MNKKYVCIITIIVAILVVICSIVYYKFFRTAKYFVLDNEDKYIVTTNEATMTAMSDGGTHYNVRYNVDLTNKKVIKVQDYYKGFEGYKYKNRIIFEKNLSDKEIEQIKTLFKEIKESYSERNNSTIGCYKIDHINDETIEVYSKQYIDRIEKLLGK